MYEGDRSHAVDLGALRWRADTLLAAAARYPLHGGESWPRETYRQATYEYVTRVIDCRNGHWGELSEALLDRDGRVLLERPVSAGQRMRGVDERRGDWPQATEIGLACLAASDPDLLRARRQMAEQAPPRLSHMPTLALLQDDQRLLGRKLRFRVDGEAVAAATPATADAVLALLVRQHRQWRRELYGPALPPAPPAPWADEATREAVGQRLNHRGEPLPLRLLPDGRFERWVPSREPAAPPDDAKDMRNLADARLMTRQLGDCRAGLAVATQLRWLDWDGQPLAERPATPDEALRSARRVVQECEELAAQAQLVENDQPLRVHTAAAVPDRGALAAVQQADAVDAEAVARALLALRSPAAESQEGAQR
jgi:hypothetical protein